MTNVKITQLPPVAGTPLSGTEVLEIVQLGVSSKVTSSKLAAAFSTDPANILPVTAGGTGSATLTGYVKGTGITAMTAAATVPVADISGTLTVPQGGTGAATLTGYVQGTGTTAMTAAATIPVADISGTLTVPQGGTGAATLTGYVQGTGTTAMTAAATIPVADISGTLTVPQGGTGAATLTGYVKGTGTTAMTAAATVPVADISGTLPVPQGGTGAVTLTGYVQGTGTTAMTASATIPYNDLAGRAYAIFYDNADLTFIANTPTAVEYNVTGLTQGITVTNNGAGDPTRITFAAAGTYEVNARFQFDNTDTNDHDASVWFRLNGADIDYSRSIITIPKAADGGKLCLSISGIVTVTAAQYIESIVVVENAAVKLDYTAPLTSPYNAPATPSAILVAQRIA